MKQIRTIAVFAYILFVTAQLQSATSLTVATPGLPKATSMNQDSLYRKSINTTKADDKKAIENKIKIIKREINYKEYVVLAIGTMVFIAVLLTSVQTWNPTSQQ